MKEPIIRLETGWPIMFYSILTFVYLVVCSYEAIPNSFSLVVWILGPVLLITLLFFTMFLKLVYAVARNFWNDIHKRKETGKGILCMLPDVYVLKDGLLKITFIKQEEKK